MKIYGLALIACGFALSTTGIAHAQKAPQAPPKDDQEEHTDAKPRQGETFVDYLWRISDDAFHKGDFEKAVKIHRSIAVVDPSDVENYSVAAWLLWSLGRGDDAVKFLDQGLKANPQDPDMWDASGQQFYMQKLMTRSHEAYVKAVALSTPEALKTPDGMMLRRRLGHATEKVGDLEGSAVIWRALVADFPDDAVNKNNLARVEGLLAESKKAPAQVIPTKGAAAISGALLVTTGFVVVGQRLSRTTRA